MNITKYYIAIIITTLVVVTTYSQLHEKWLVYNGLLLICNVSIICIKLATNKQNKDIDTQLGEQTAQNIDKTNALLIQLHKDTKSELEFVNDENSQVQSLLNNAIEGLVASFQGLKNEANQQKNMVFLLGSVLTTNVFLNGAYQLLGLILPEHI